MHKQILGAATLVAGLGSVILFLAGDPPGAATDAPEPLPRVAIVPGDGSSALVDQQSPDFRRRLSVHSGHVASAVAPLVRESNGSALPTAETAALTVDALARAQGDLPLPDRTNRDDTALYAAYLAALRALHWGAQDIATAAVRNDSSRMARGQRWLLDGRARLDEVQRELR